MGLFTVLERIGKQAYKLNLPPSMQRLYPTFYVLLLEPYKARAGYQPPPVDDLEEDDNGDRYEIEKIVKHWVENGRRLYRVRWLGYSLESDSNITEEELDGA